VCLNVALIAMIAAAIASSAFRHPRSHWAAGPLGINALMEAAKPEERTKIEAIVEAHRARVDQLRKEADEERRAAVRIFAQPAFNEAEYAKALDRVRLTNDSLQGEVSKMMEEAASQLSPQERAEIAERPHGSIWRLWRHRHFW
jgi:uncharacterized membrane protein